MLFIVISILLLLLALYHDLIRRGKSKNYMRIYNFIYVFLALLMAFRYGVGIDTPRYMLLYDLIPNLLHLGLDDFNIYRAQPLYIFINSVCKTIYDNFVTLQLLQAALFFHSFYLISKKLDLRKFYLLLCFFCYDYIHVQSALRECFGLAFCFYALYFYLEKKWLHYYSLVFLGFMCHSGMIVFFFIPLIRLFKRVNVKGILIISGLVILTFVIAFQYQDYLILVGEGSLGRYLSGEEIEGAFRLSSLLYFILFVLFWYFLCARNYRGEHVDFVYLGLIFLLFVLIGSSYLPILYRYTTHFLIFYFYCISYMLRKAGRDTIVIFMLLLLFYYSPLRRFAIKLTVDPSVSHYCSVFSSDKAYQDKLINETHTRDMYEFR